MDLDAALTFFDFVAERHRIYERRQAGQPQPWTEDPILASHKFTNVFRVLDPGSQFVFELFQPDDDPVDVLARLFLYRHTNNPIAWAAYAIETGGYPDVEDLDDLLKFWREQQRWNGLRLFSGAYMIYPQSSEPGTEKIVSVVNLTRKMVDNGTIFKVITADSPAERFAELRQNKGVADFMSMQILTDWGYTPQCGEDQENEFVVAGPGSRRGALLLDPGSSPESTIRWAQKVFWGMDRRIGVHFPRGSRKVNRFLSLMDVQNCFCEFSKYVKRKPGKPYKPAHPHDQRPPILPTHWGN